jgi:TPR repeat protein
MHGDHKRNHHLVAQHVLVLAGMGMPQDFAKAHQYFSQAATRQNPLGLYGLGYLYLSGSGVEQNHELALKYFQQAAEQGDRDAHFYLGAMYMNVSVTGVVANKRLS